MAELPPIPPGFELSKAPPIPPGFQLVKPEATPENTERQNLASGLLDSFTHGFAFGFGDELTAAEAALLGKTPEGSWLDYSRPFSERYERALEAERAQNEAFQEEHPVASGAAELAGAIANPATRALPVSSVPKAMGSGAVAGGVYSAGEGEGVEGRITDAAIGTVIGAGAGAVTGKIASALTKKAAPMTTEQLKTASQASYRAAEDAGVIISRESFKNFVSGAQRKLAEEGIDKGIHPKTLSAFNRLNEVDDNITLEGLEILRRVSKNAAKSNDPAERRMAQILIGEIDDYMQNLRPGDVLSGAGEEAVAALNKARGLWSRAKKAEVVEDAILAAHDRASQFSGSGFENALRTEFRKIVMNKGLMRTFTDVERKALRRVARGDRMTNILRYLGKFSPEGSIVSSALSAGMGAALGGPVGAAAFLGGGAAARRGATALTGRSARLAGDVMRQGGPVTSQRPLTKLEQQLLQYLTVSGATGPQ